MVKKKKKIFMVVADQHMWYSNEKVKTVGDPCHVLKKVLRRAKLCSSSSCQRCHPVEMGIDPW